MRISMQQPRLLSISSAEGQADPSFKMESHLRLIRDHMMELNTFYGMLFL